MNNMLEYGGYHAKLEFDSDDNIFVGTVFGINDSLSFHGSSIDELKSKFKDCIDDYLLLCEQIGKEPDKEFKGSFNIRISPSLHRELAKEAYKKGVSLNQLVEQAIERFLHMPDLPSSTTIVINSANYKEFSHAIESPSYNYNWDLSQFLATQFNALA